MNTNIAKKIVKQVGSITNDYTTIEERIELHTTSDIRSYIQLYTVNLILNNPSNFIKVNSLQELDNKLLGLNGYKTVFKTKL